MCKQCNGTKYQQKTFIKKGQITLSEHLISGHLELLNDKEKRNANKSPSHVHRDITKRGLHSRGIKLSFHFYHPHAKTLEHYFLSHFCFWWFYWQSHDSAGIYWNATLQPFHIKFNFFIIKQIVMAFLPPATFYLFCFDTVLNLCN